MSIPMRICPKCAWLKARKISDFCNEQMVLTESLVEETMKMSDKQKGELINHYIETLIKDTYDPEARAYREANDSYVPFTYYDLDKPTCPSCGSTRISQIGTVSRAVSVGIFGLASSKIGKTHKCNNCGATW